MAKTALITGASTGIGFAFAKVCAKKGYNLILAARNKERLEAHKSFLETEFSISVTIFPVDLSAKGGAESLYNFCVNHSQVDVLINNAGIGQYGCALETSPEHEYSMMQLNMCSLVALTKLFGKDMVSRGTGNIVNISSIAAFLPFPYMAVYAATKAFVLSYSKALAYECTKYGVKVSTVCPGPVATEFEKTAGMEASNLFKLVKPHTAMFIAEKSIDPCLKGKIVVIPGMLNKLIILAVSFLPKFITAKFIAFIASKSKVAKQ